MNADLQALVEKWRAITKKAEARMVDRAERGEAYTSDIYLIADLAGALHEAVAALLAQRAQQSPEGVLFVEFLEALPEDDPSRVFLNEWRAYNEPTIDTRYTDPRPPWTNDGDPR